MPRTRDETDSVAKRSRVCGLQNLVQVILRTRLESRRIQEEINVVARSHHLPREFPRHSRHEGSGYQSDSGESHAADCHVLREAVAGLCEVQNVIQRLLPVDRTLALRCQSLLDAARPMVVKLFASRKSMDQECRPQFVIPPDTRLHCSWRCLTPCRR